MAENATPQNAIADDKSKLRRNRYGEWTRLTDREVDEAAAFLNRREHSVLVSYDKEDLSFEAVALKLGDVSTRSVQRAYKAIRGKLDRAIHSSSLAGAGSSQTASSSTTPALPALTSTSTGALENATSNLTLNNETPNSVPHSTTTTATSLPTSNTMAEDEKPFIPMDDPRRTYPIPGTKYAMCQPGLTGSWAGYKNTPEQQQVMDDFHRANWERVEHMTQAELRAHIDAVIKSVNDKDEADRLLTEDINRQQDELRAQREVERRVYYRQKALKEARKKDKEERARARAVARGEMVEDGEGGGAGSSGPAHGSGEGMAGVVENGAANGGDAGNVDGNAIAEVGQGVGYAGAHAASDIDGSALPQDRATADGLAHAVDNAF